MLRFSSAAVGVTQGSIVMFSSFQDGGEMWTGHGPRAARSEILFDEPFRAAPKVQVSISMWDIDQQSNQRADISAEDISAFGFTLVFKTWGDTRVARIRADWMALGPVAHEEDDWDTI